MSRAALIAAAVVAAAVPAMAEGFLVGRAQRAPDIEVGLGDAGYGVKQDPFTFETGKGYRMWIKATGKKECAFEADEFFKHIWLRKIEVNKVELKVQTVHEIEFEDEGAAELFFTPIKPGEYVWVCKGLADKGMTGKIVVK
jgi:uncharacterized cupredoxin-like copper-binding protein